MEDNPVQQILIEMEKLNSPVSSISWSREDLYDRKDWIHFCL